MADEQQENPFNWEPHPQVVRFLRPRDTETHLLPGDTPEHPPSREFHLQRQVEAYANQVILLDARVRELRSVVAEHRNIIRQLQGTVERLLDEQNAASTNPE